MKILLCSIALSSGVMGTAAHANLKLNIDGEDYTLEELTAKCQSITGDPAAQIACFGELSKLLEAQNGGAEEDKIPPAQALQDLQNVAQYEDNETGLLISGSDCTINTLYFSNYFHISRRNISTIDLISAEFDASKMQYDQTVEVSGGPAPLVKGVLTAGAKAATRGGMALDSARDNFEPKSPRASIAAYATTLADALPATEGQSFNFVLIHPNKAGSSAEIWSAFETYVDACQ